MKPKNFPARKAARQVGAALKMPCRFLSENDLAIVNARTIRTKKSRAAR